MWGLGRKELSEEQSIVSQCLLLQVTAITDEIFNIEKRADSSLEINYVSWRLSYSMKVTTGYKNIVLITLGRISKYGNLSAESPTAPRKRFLL